MPLTPEQLIRDEIRALTAYSVPDATGYVKLDAMENPYALPPEAKAELSELMQHAQLNRYPDAAGQALRARLQAVMQVPPGMEILLGNGSDEIIQILAMAIARPGALIMGVEPSFVMYKMIAAFVGLGYIAVPLRADFTLDTEAVLAAMRETPPALLFLAYPNNPSGNLFPAADVEKILQAAPGLVVVDEAYHVFAKQSFMSALPRYPNLIVMRTLSKLGLAGLRLGFVAGAPAWLKQLDKLRLPYNVNVLTQGIAERLLSLPELFAAQAAAICEARAELSQAMRALPGVEVFASDANFILYRVDDADRVFQGIKQRGVLIKNLSRAHPLLQNCLRVTVGTPDENQQFLTALQASL